MTTLAVAAPTAVDVRVVTVSTSSRRQRLALEHTCLCARICEDNKGKDVLVLDTRSVTTEFDFLVIATGNSRRQIHAMAEEIDDRMREEGENRLGIEGYESCKWLIQDYGDIVVHLFDTFSRDYYRLEDLWAHAKRVEWTRY